MQNSWLCICVCIHTYIYISMYACVNVHIYKHLEVHILSSNTKNQCILNLNPVCIFQVKMKTWEPKRACRAGNPLGKSQETWYLRGSFTASSCSGNAEWETQLQHCQSSALRALRPVKEHGGKSHSTLMQTLGLQPAFLQLLGERCGDPGVAVISVGRILFPSCMKKSPDGKTWRTAEIPEVLNLHSYLLLCFHWRM